MFCLQFLNSLKKCQSNLFKIIFCFITIYYIQSLLVSNIYLLKNFKISYRYSFYESIIGQEKAPRIFCFILTSKSNLATKAKVIQNTWASKCDNYKLVTLIPDYLKNKSLPHVLVPPGLINDTYNKLTDKVLLTIKHLYNEYDNYDWYLKADDDTFIFVDNLRKFLSDKNSSSPVTYGYDFKVIIKGGYHSGGAGYLLSNEALKRLGSLLNKNFSNCWNSGVEDTDVADCLRRVDVYPNKSVDTLGRQRFHPYNIKKHYDGINDPYFDHYSADEVKKVEF